MKLDIIILILKEALKGSLDNMLQIAVIVIPLMLFIEIFRDLNLLDRLTGLLAPFTRLLGISKEGNLPLLAGVIFGISYGGGVIINSSREGKLSLKEIYLINLFLIICHSVFEDTVLFAAIGAQWLPILISRFLMAVVVCYIYSQIVFERDRQAN